MRLVNNITNYNIMNQYFNLISIVFFFLFVFKTDACASNGKGKINFLNFSSFKEVQKIAKKKNKPIFIDFYSPYCAPCKKMDKEVFKQKKVVSYMNRNFINYKIDITKGNGPILSLLYEIKYLPTVIIVMPDGEIIAKKTSTMNDIKFLKWVKNAKTIFYAYSFFEKIKKNLNFKPKEFIFKNEEEILV